MSAATAVHRAHLSVKLGGGHSDCHTYDDYAPILSIGTGSVTVSLTVRDSARVTKADALAARELFDAARSYLAELDRMYAEQQLAAEEVA